MFSEPLDDGLANLELEVNAYNINNGREEGHAELFALLENGVSLAEAKKLLGG